MRTFDHEVSNGSLTMRQTRRGRVGGFFLCVLLMTLPSRPVHAQIPHLIRYQGQAMDSKGVPLEGPYTLTFRFYDAATGGTKVWEETQLNVPLTTGRFSVLLGQITSLDPIDWSHPLWLSVQVNTDPELTPRQQITSVPLAMRAERAEQLTQSIAPTQLTPQGSGSSLDADTVDGKHATDLLNRTNHTGTQLSSTITGTFPPSAISPQGSGSGLNADLLDGKDSSAFASNPHSHSCSYYNNALPSGQTPAWLCAQHGEWCVAGLSAGGRDPMACTSVNPGFGDWGAICCR